MPHPRVGALDADDCLVIYLDDLLDLVEDR